MSGVVSLRTYFLLAHPTEATMLVAKSSVNEVRVIC
jgi:hypothetical protein